MEEDNVEGLNGLEIVNDLGQLDLQSFHLGEHGSGGVADEGDSAGVAAVAEDGAFGPHSAAAGGAKHFDGSGIGSAGAGGVAQQALSAVEAAAGAHLDN